MIIVNLSDDVVVFGDALGLDESGAWGADWRAPWCTPAEYELLDLPVPAGFVGGRYLLVDGEVVPTEDLATERKAEAKLQAWEAIKVFRDNRLLTGGYPAAGHWYYSDLIARSQHLGNARKADRVEAAEGDMSANLVNSEDEPVVVKSMDNGYTGVSATLAHQIMNAAEVQEMATYKAALIHKSTMEASADPAAYDFKSSGWPDIYEPAP